MKKKKRKKKKKKEKKKKKRKKKVFAKDYDYYFHQDVTQVITANCGRNVDVHA